VAVEKLLPAKFAKIKSRQEAPQSIFSGRVDIFYPPNFGCLGQKVSFSTATPGYNSYDSQRCDGLLSDENGSATESSQGTAQIAEDPPIIGLF